MVAFAAALLAAAAAALLVLALGAAALGSGAVQARRSLEPTRLLVALLARLRTIAPRAQRRLLRRGADEALRRAGLDALLTPRDVATARALCLLIALLLVVPRLAAALPVRTLPLVLPFVLWAAAELPLFLLARRGARRAAEFRAALPDALDLLRACLAAGLPLRRSLALVAEHCAEPVAGEFAGVAAEVAYGIPQSAALAELVERNPLAEVRALVRAVDQAGRNGSPLAPVIAAQARDARLAHNRTILERGARAGPKIQLVISATIVPGALLGLGAIVIAAIARGELTIF